MTPGRWYLRRGLAGGAAGVAYLRAALKALCFPPGRYSRACQIRCNSAQHCLVRLGHSSLDQVVNDGFIGDGGDVTKVLFTACNLSQHSTHYLSGASLWQASNGQHEIRRGHWSDGFAN
ncbi:hypothetical protein TYRP_018328 [Tyrophagus putrescentiae]|nr:hypothetical protein TYRP_018328 [Tyrophagus putrescentiae]